MLILVQNITYIVLQLKKDNSNGFNDFIFADCENIWFEDQHDDQ